MSLIYALVAKEPDIVLCDETDYEGNYADCALHFLKKIERNTKGTSRTGKVKYHFLNSKGLTFLAITEKAYNDNLAIYFLETINNRFIEKYSKKEIKKATRYSMKDSFSFILRKEMDNYSNKSNREEPKLNDNVNKKHNLFDGIKNLFKDRGDKLNLYEQKAKKLRDDEEELLELAKEIRENEESKNFKITVSLIVIVVVIILIYVILWVVCKGPSLPHCIK